MQTDTAVKPKINELHKFSMFTASPNAEGKRSRLAWCIRDGNPRISVYTNDPNDKVSYGIIPCPMNPETFLIFINLFEKVIKGENNNKYKIDCFTAYKDNEGKRQDPILLSELWFGKDENGIVWISALALNRPKIRFNFAISDFHRFYKADGNPLNESESSQMQAYAVITAIKDIYTSLFSGFRPTFDNSKFSNPKFPQNNSDKTPVATDSFFEDIAF